MLFGQYSVSNLFLLVGMPAAFVQLEPGDGSQLLRSWGKAKAREASRLAVAS